MIMRSRDREIQQKRPEKVSDTGEERVGELDGVHGGGVLFEQL